MKFVVSSSALLTQVQALNGVLNSSVKLPILDYFLFTITENQLTILASDLETSMSATVEIQAKEEGKIAVPAKLLLDTLKTFPEQPLTFTIEGDFLIEIHSDNGKYKLSGANPEEFPRVPSIENPSEVNIQAEILLRAISKSIFATSNDELKPVMTGVYFQLDTDHMTFVATDAHKLVKYTSRGNGASKASTFIVPKKPLNLLKSLLNNTSAEINVSFSEANANFTFDNYVLTCRLIDGSYPNYDAVIPKNNPNVLTIDRQTFLNSIKRISIFASKSTHQVKLKMVGSELTISAEDIDFANAANERITCNYDGEDMEIAFNSRFIIDMLNNIESDEITLNMSNANRAGIIQPTTSFIDGEELLMLVMPVMISQS